MRLRAVCLSSPACLLHAVGLRKINFFHPHQRPLNTDTSAQRDPAPALRIAEHISRGTCVSECLSQRTKNHTKGHTDWNYIRYGRKKIRAWWIPRVLLLHKTKNATKMIFSRSENIFMIHWTQWIERGFRWRKCFRNDDVDGPEISSRLRLVNPKLGDFPRFGMSARRFSPAVPIHRSRKSLTTQILYLGHEETGRN